MLGTILGFGKSIVDGFMVKRKANAEAHREVTIARGKAEAAAMLEASKSVSDWEKIQAQASATSWKDELWTVVFCILVLGIFVGNLIGYGPQVNSAIDAVQELGKSVPYVGEGWLAVAIFISIMASFGMRTLPGMFGGKAPK